MPRVALVTGGASGIGRAACLLFATVECSVAVVDTNEAGGLETVQQLSELYAAKWPLTHAGRPKAVFIKADVSNEEDVKYMMQEVTAKFGRLDFCLNNAGIEGCRALVHEYPTDVFDRVMSVNVRGVFLCLKHQVPLMLQNADGPGAIVITSSTAGVNGMAEFSAYSASKHALVGLMRSTAAEYGPKDLRINCINPATTDTPMVARFASQWPEWQAATNASYPLGRIATAQEVAEAAVWICTKATFMTGQTLVMDGGASCC